MKIFRLKIEDNKTGLVFIHSSKKQKNYNGFTFLGMAFLKIPAIPKEIPLVELILHELTHIKQFRKGVFNHFKTRTNVKVMLEEEVEAYLGSVRDTIIFSEDTRDVLKEVYTSYHWNPYKKPYSKTTAYSNHKPLVQESLEYIYKHVGVDYLDMVQLREISKELNHNIKRLPFCKDYSDIELYTKVRLEIIYLNHLISELKAC